MYMNQLDVIIARTFDIFKNRSVGDWKRLNWISNCNVIEWYRANLIRSN